MEPGADRMALRRSMGPSRLLLGSAESPLRLRTTRLKSYLLQLPTILSPTVILRCGSHQILNNIIKKIIPLNRLFYFHLLSLSPIFIFISLPGATTIIFENAFICDPSHCSYTNVSPVFALSLSLKHPRSAIMHLSPDSHTPVHHPQLSST